MTQADWVTIGLVVFGYVAERAQFFSAESKQTIRVLVRAVNDPSAAKQTVKESSVKNGFLLNRELDNEEPRKIGELGEAPRVSRARRIGRFLVGLLPGVSRIRSVRNLLF
jgi:hypothetical protein